MSVEDKYSKVISLLESMTLAQEIKGRTWAIFKYALDAVSAYGVTIPRLRKVARDIGRDHELAQKLWAANIRETRILATMIDELDKVTEAQMEKWVSDFFYWEICDQCCMNLFAKTEFAYQRCVAWSSRDEEYVKRAGFVLMACLALSDKKADDKQFQTFLRIIKREATDTRNFVKRAVNRALRQIGKRNLNLNSEAIETTKEIQKTDSRSASWIASHAIRELTSEAVQQRLRHR